MAKAKITIMTPVFDNLGNKLKDIAAAAHDWLFHNKGMKNSTITRGHEGHWENYPREGMDSLWMIVEDTPENDSATKQVCAWIADVANQETVYWLKEGGGHIQDALIRGSHFQPGQGAAPQFIEDLAPRL